MATAPVSFNNTTDPRKAAANQRQYLTAQGDALQQQYGDQYRAQTGGAPVNTVAGTANYLNDIEDPLAHGQGGYNPDEAGQIQLSQGDQSQIEYSPQDVANVENKARVASGQATAASVGAAERTAAASGGSPAALATYRARAARTAGVDAGDAAANAAVTAKNAQSGAATTAVGLKQAGGRAVGDARIGQQNQGLQYYGQQNKQANDNSQQANQLQTSTYGTEANAGNNATDSVIKASQTPTGWDKAIGAATGVLGALADGTMPTGTDAVVGENGPEWVGKPSYMADGDPDAITDIDPAQSYGTDYSAQPQQPQPFWKRLAAGMKDPAPAQQQPKEQWNPTTPYNQAGSAIGKLAKFAFMDDGAVPADGEPLYDQADGDPYPDAATVPPRSMLAEGQIITKPTAIKLEQDDAVVPLSYRPQAKARPSMAMNKPAKRNFYGAAA